MGESVDPSELVAVTARDVSMLAIPDTIQPVPEERAGEEVAPRDDGNVNVPPDGPEWQVVESLQPGTWLEFCFTEENITRAKLSWISPMSGRYLFVNRRGLKVGDYAPHELAVLLADGRARVLAANALFDRAMTAIVGRLRESTPATAETGAAPGAMSNASSTPGEPPRASRE